MSLDRFFACTECGTVIVAEPERLFEGMRDCPACLEPGRAGVGDPFEIVEVTNE